MSVFNKDLERSLVARKVPVPVSEIRSMRHLVERCSRLIHSNARILKDEKLPLLAALSDVKRLLDGHLQLELFSPAQLEE